MAKARSGIEPTQQDVQPVLNQLEQGQLEAACEGARALTKRFPKHFFGFNLLGTALSGLGRSAEAIEAYQRAVKLEPRMADLHFNLGFALAAANRLEPASASYRKALQINPTFFEAWGNLGTLAQRRGHLDEAITAYRKALAIHEDAQGLFNIATALRDSGRLEEAVSAYTRSLALGPDNPNTHNNLGETLRDQGRMDAAVEAYQAALKRDSKHPRANYNMAEYYVYAHQYDQAVPYFERSGLDDFEERVLYCLYKSEQFAAFKTGLDRMLASGPHTRPFLATLSAHYAHNFSTEDTCRFCPNGLEFVYRRSIPELTGTQSKLRQQLMRDIAQVAIEARSQGRLHHGVQSAGNLFKRPESSFRKLGALVRQEFERYRAQFADSDCALITHFPRTLEFTSSWYVRMRQGGHLDAHIHEIGWISGAVYLAMPPAGASEEGAFEYGMHGDDLPVRGVDFPAGRVLPEVGDIVLFPSSLFHRTVPFNSDVERVCIAFDLRPE